MGIYWPGQQFSQWAEQLGPIAIYAAGGGMTLILLSYAFWRFGSSRPTAMGKQTLVLLPAPTACDP